MRAVVQRVENCSVGVSGRTVGSISRGLLVYLGVAVDDSEADADFLAEKICGLRIFEDGEEKMNLSVNDTRGEILVVSQFTLCADTRKGKRPSYSGAALPEKAVPLYEYFVQKVRKTGIRTETGEFGASMDVAYVNKGPVTILLDSKKLF
jgi:D-tyrosyl-tRNA(Tyr) deacylase